MYKSKHTGEEIDRSIGAMQYVTNPNLLDNAYFGNPVNQRGLTEYTGAGYTIDRWKFAATGGVARKTDGGIFFGCIDQTHAYINHPLEISLRDGLNGKLCTLSALTVDGNLYTASSVWGADALIANLGGENLLYSNPGDAGVNLRVDSTGVTLAAAKLELGSEQTLAHQDADGNWVLNEIPDYGEQLRRCQRYFMRYKAGTVLPCVAYSEQDGWYLDAVLPITEMRTSPVHNIGEGLACSVRNINAESDFISKTITNLGEYSGVQLLRISGGEKTSATWPYIIRMDADLTFSADL